MSLIIPVILVGSAIILAVLLLLLWPLDKEFFGKWGRRMAICYRISLVAISARHRRRMRSGVAKLTSPLLCRTMRASTLGFGGRGSVVLSNAAVGSRVGGGPRILVVWMIC